LRVLPQGLIKELDATAGRLACFQQHHRLDIVAGESIWARNHDTIDRSLIATVTDPIQAWPMARCTTVAVVAEAIRRPECFPLYVDMGGEPLNLLLNRWAETARLTGPAERDLTVPDQAKFVIGNHTIEQDQRAVKRVTRPPLGFKSFVSAQATIVGIKPIHMLRQGHMEGDAVAGAALRPNDSAPWLRRPSIR
jgi:hypothetical protein